MARIISLDYGLKRTGVAVTDPLRIIATGLDTISTADLLPFLKKYFETEPVDIIVLGLPTSLRSEDTDATEHVKKFGAILTSTFPDKKMVYYDERFTSKMALRALIDSGTSKKDRRDKGSIDKVSAVIILQDYMQSIS